MKKFNNQSYYEILEIKQDASYKEIEDAYKRAKETYSGESLATYSLFTAEECREILDAVEDAYKILSFSKTREEYNRRLAAGLSIEEIEPLHIEEPAKTVQLIVTESWKEIVPENKETFQSAPATIKTDVEILKAAQTFKEAESFDGVEFRGSILKIIRERRCISLNLVAEKTKININYLENIEAEKYHQLPAEVFLKSYLSQYARFLGLDAKKVVEDYMRFYEKR
ncbi:MAG: helix-turn-helix domain-containing protein [Nitrospirota bacterium]